MLQPKKQKYRKQQKGRFLGRRKETRGVILNFGNIGLQAEEGGWIKANQIEAARKAVSHTLAKEGKFWIRIFPDKPITQLPPEVTMGGGKGEVDHYVAPVRPGRIIFEIDGVSTETATRALKNAGHKLPIKTRIISK